MSAVIFWAIYMTIAPFAAIGVMKFEKGVFYFCWNERDKIIYYLIALFFWWFVLPIDIFMFLRRGKR